MEEKVAHTLITGASMGLGRSIAYECARRNRNLILLSLPNEGLKEFSKSLEREFSIRCVCSEFDLTNSEQLEFRVRHLVKEFRIEMLVNNAGLGGTRSIANHSIAELDFMLLLNVRSLVVLTQLVLPSLRREANAHILNISSMAAYGFVPNKGIYPASKAFVASFSKSLRSELHSSSVSVSVAYPGGMLTKPSIAERVKGYNWLIRTTFQSPDSVAKHCVSSCLSGSFRIVPGVMNRLCRWLLTLTPRSIQIRLFNQAMETEFTKEKAKAQQVG